MWLNSLLNLECIVTSNTRTEYKIFLMRIQIIIKTAAM